MSIHDIDDADRKILSILQANAKTSNAEIAKIIGMAPSATLERIRKLEKRGIIEGYHAKINRAALNYDLCAYVFLKIDTVRCEDIYELLKQIPEILEIHSVAGDDCLLVKVRANGVSHFNNILKDNLLENPKVSSTRSCIALETIKETIEIPIEMK